jgi:lysophospholipase L1-like esterase
MAAVAAQPVFRLLGAKDLGVPGDYRAAKMPPVNHGLLDGTLAWRQHDGGHTDAPNWKYFLAWADGFMGRRFQAPADEAMQRSDHNSEIAHEQLLEKAKQGHIDIYFEGDSITRRWDAKDYPELQSNWKRNFYGWNAADFGWGGDTTQNILWRLENGELDGVQPKIIVLLAGTNNVGSSVLVDGEAEAADIVRGVDAIVHVLQAKAPDAVIVLTGIFPRNDNMAAMPVIDAINANLAKLADGTKLRYVDLDSKLADGQGKLLDGMLNAKDRLHPTARGYQVWADALRPIFSEILGAPKDHDDAPPPTGDPSAQGTLQSVRR